MASYMARQHVLLRRTMLTTRRNQGSAHLLFRASSSSSSSSPLLSSSSSSLLPRRHHILSNCNKRRSTTPLSSPSSSFSFSSSSTSSSHKTLNVEYDPQGGIVTLTMNDPRSYNAWKNAMLKSIEAELNRCLVDDSVNAVILTGTDPYYCSGAYLAELLKPMSPAALHQRIYQSNKDLFDMFLEFRKPIFAAVNGPAIGASVTSATLMDGIIASENASFSTPFSALGIVPEGCSSVHFARLMGEENADRMLGPEGWRPTATEAEEVGFISEKVDNKKEENEEKEKEGGGGGGVVQAAKKYARTFLREGRGKLISDRPGTGKIMDVPLVLPPSTNTSSATEPQWWKEGAEGLLRKHSRTKDHNDNENDGGGDKRSLLERYKEVNDRESRALADAILGVPFLLQQEKMARSKGKNQMANAFRAIRITRPAWSLFL